MPYIDPKRRPAVAAFTSSFPVTPGELNYAITKLLSDYVRRKGVNYEALSAAVAAARDAADEFKRRVMDPYEDEKCRIHGDVYPTEILTPPQTMPVPPLEPAAAVCMETVPHIHQFEKRADGVWRCRVCDREVASYAPWDMFHFSGV